MSLVIKQFAVNPFVENTYIAHCSQSKEAVIIDCGAYTDAEFDMIDAYIQNEHLTVRHIINTHLHLDHCFGNHAATSRYGVMPMAAEADADLVPTLAQQALLFGISSPVQSQKLGGYLHDGDIIPFGNEQLQVLATPGHTRGGLCFYSEAGCVLFSGDTLFEESIGRTDLPGGSMKTLLESIKSKLMTLPDNITVFPGHGGCTSIGNERVNNPFLDL